MSRKCLVSWGAGIFHLSFLVLGFKHAVPEMIASWKMHTDLMIGVIVCPITSGDTAFRSARLVLADWFEIDQNKMQKRTDALCTAAGSRCICRTSGLCNRMEILQLDKPDTGYDRSVDSKYVSVP